MSIFTNTDILDILNVHKETRKQSYKALLDLYVDEAVEYYANLIADERSRIYHEIMDYVSYPYAYGSNTCYILIKKMKTYKAKDCLPDSKNLMYAKMMKQVDTGAYFGTVNIYTLFKHTDFAKKLAARVGDRFTIKLTAYHSNDEHDSVIEFTNCLYLVMNLRDDVDGTRTTHVTY